MTRTLLFLLFNLSSIAAAAQVKLAYGVGTYTTDSSRAAISGYQHDSLLLEIQFYKDKLEEERRKNYLLENTARKDTVKFGKDSMIISYMNLQNNLLAKFVYNYPANLSCRLELKEYYCNDKGSLYYFATTWQPLCKEGSITWVDRKRYEYDEQGILIKVVNEYFISAGHLVQRLTNNTGKQLDPNKGPDLRAFKTKKIKAYEFWD